MRTIPQQVGEILSQTFHTRGTIMETAPSRESLIPGRFKPTIHANLRWSCTGNGGRLVVVKIVAFSLDGNMLDQVARSEARSARTMLAREGFESGPCKGGEVTEYPAKAQHRRFMYALCVFKTWLEPSRA